ncbi:hypothetical protein N1031_10290 [Herbiconiux moechotypicola]|uniref:Uncharacterized protein n=1 Tax=Herbiconiux moechotypicola TaxID=637393 RepID=A0ABN3DLC0_9MICO|nr:hypothetical protein [Herbiconiux moechotypicola]MCS5730151.1 hypothetical protein [Herbiconiux moechotypicola]
MTEPTEEQLEASQHTDKRTVGGELRYYLKDVGAHLAKLNQPFNPDGLEAWFTPDGTFHAEGVGANAALPGMLGAAAVTAINAG